MRPCLCISLAWPLFGWKLRSGLMGEDETRRGMRDRRKFSGKFSWVRKIDSNALSLSIIFFFFYIYLLILKILKSKVTYFGYVYTFFFLPPLFRFGLRKHRDRTIIKRIDYFRKNQSFRTHEFHITQCREQSNFILQKSNQIKPTAISSRTTPFRLPICVPIVYSYSIILFPARATRTSSSR